MAKRKKRKSKKEKQKQEREKVNESGSCLETQNEELQEVSQQQTEVPVESENGGQNGVNTLEASHEEAMNPFEVGNTEEEQCEEAKRLVLILKSNLDENSPIMMSVVMERVRQEIKNAFLMTLNRRGKYRRTIGLMIQVATKFQLLCEFQELLLSLLQKCLEDSLNGNLDDHIFEVLQMMIEDSCNVHDSLYRERVMETIAHYTLQLFSRLEDGEYKYCKDHVKILSIFKFVADIWMIPPEVIGTLEKLHSPIFILFEKYLKTILKQNPPSNGISVSH